MHSLSWFLILSFPLFVSNSNHVDVIIVDKGSILVIREYSFTDITSPFIVVGAALAEGNTPVLDV